MATLANGQQPGSNLYRVPSGGVGPTGEQIYDVFSGTEHIADPNDPRLKGVNLTNLPTGQAPQGFQSKFPTVQGSKFEKGFNQAKASGAKVPSGAVGEKGLIDQNVPPEDTSGNLGFLQGNQYLQGLISSYQSYIDPKNQSTSLVDTYNQLIKDSGIQQIDANLVNMQNVINGTEDDIRTEVMKSGGFATDSQVLALTSARNKQLIKNYNNLTALRDSKSQYLQTEIGLAQQDKQAADQRFNTAFNMEGQIAQMGIQMQNNAYERFTNLQKSIGWDGIYNSVKDDPNAIDLVEKFMGMPSGSLSTAASQASTERSMSLATAQAELGLKRAQIAKTDEEARALGLQRRGDSLSTFSNQVSMTADNVPSKSQQSSYLSSLPGGANGELATLVKGIAEYAINPSSVPTRNYKGVGGLTQSQVLTLVRQYDPTFEQGQYAARQALQTNFKSGKYSQNINSLNTAVGHIVDLLGNTAKLNNTGFTPYNVAKNQLQKLFGVGDVGRASLNIAAATSELATVFKGSGATDEEIKALGSVDANSSPDQIKAYIETATQLLASRLAALEETYTAGMGKSPSKPFLSSTSVSGLLGLQKSGFNIQVPEIARAPQVLLQTFHDSDPKNAKMLDDLVAADPSLGTDPNKMIDFLAQNGIEL